MVSLFSAVFFAVTAKAAATLAGEDKSCLLQTGQSRASIVSGDSQSQGTFSLWRFSGIDSVPVSQTKTVPVDWQIYTRYSGHPAFTKGLLLVDNSGGKQRQALEITAQDCQWRAQKGNQEWTLVKDGERLSVPEGNDYVTGFIMTKTDGLKGQSNVQLNMQMKDFAKDVALLSLACRPRQHINFQVAMQQRGDSSFVQGALKVPRMSFVEASSSFIDTSASFVEAAFADKGVAVKSSWRELGGSSKAAAYFQIAEAQKISLLHTASEEVNQSDSKQLATSAAASCGPKKRRQARKTCSKHLGFAKNRNREDQAFFDDCVFDVCHGGGEEAAEMAAELMRTSQLG